ncbi:hypothetical protein E2C01_016383 [Portunus trituberculatus]|uniref:Uncharacterized protein n=1 Tax=Portunus trituberculatus TaxID=210409 RepID=A0A5B7DP92_PORTR|nr:hypothetical protein [Portunus trituberculatus]
MPFCSMLALWATGAITLPWPLVAALEGPLGGLAAWGEEARKRWEEEEEEVEEVLEESHGATVV